MTTVDDIIRAMHERPDVRAEIRRAILTDELLELPDRFAALTVRVDDIAVQTAANTKAIEALTVRVDDIAVQTAANTKAIEALTVQTAANTKAIEALTVRVDDLTVRLDRLTNAGRHADCHCRSTFRVSQADH